MAKGHQPADDLGVELSWPDRVERVEGNQYRPAPSSASATRPGELEAIRDRLDDLSARVEALTELVQSLASRRAPARRPAAD